MTPPPRARTRAPQANHTGVEPRLGLALRSADPAPLTPKTWARERERERQREREREREGKRGKKKKKERKRPRHHGQHVQSESRLRVPFPSPLTHRGGDGRFLRRPCEQPALLVVIVRTQSTCCSSRRARASSPPAESCPGGTGAPSSSFRSRPSRPRQASGRGRTSRAAAACLW